MHDVQVVLLDDPSDLAAEPQHRGGSGQPRQTVKDDAAFLQRHDIALVSGAAGDVDLKASLDLRQGQRTQQVRNARPIGGEVVRDVQNTETISIMSNQIIHHNFRVTPVELAIQTACPSLAGFCVATVDRAGDGGGEFPVLSELQDPLGKTKLVLTNTQT